MSSIIFLISADLFKGVGCEILRFSRWISSSAEVVCMTENISNISIKKESNLIRPFIAISNNTITIQVQLQTQEGKDNLTVARTEIFSSYQK